ISAFELSSEDCSIYEGLHRSNSFATDIGSVTYSTSQQD
ncbi:hypothetical protein A2U01_0101594, partial [Trifolium medium]|nr:hypothetical protein [Trifolium medium]